MGFRVESLEFGVWGAGLCSLLVGSSCRYFCRTVGLLLFCFHPRLKSTFEKSP